MWPFRVMMPNVDVSAYPGVKLKSISRPAVKRSHAERTASSFECLVKMRNATDFQPSKGRIDCLTVRHTWPFHCTLHPDPGLRAVNYRPRCPLAAAPPDLPQGPVRLTLRITRGRRTRTRNCPEPDACRRVHAVVRRHVLMLTCDAYHEISSLCSRVSALDPALETAPRAPAAASPSATRTHAARVPVRPTPAPQ